MKVNPCEKLEAGRVRQGDYKSPSGCMHGAFFLTGPSGARLRVISSGSGAWCDGWEHVSVSPANRCPNWPEMCFVKDLFWREDEAVTQYHPPKALYVNHHPHCLHMWLEVGVPVRLPPMILVGPKSEEDADEQVRAQG
jgi:hypothetical protein